MPFAYPLRLQIQYNICDALREITPGNGYATDMSGTGDDNKVFRGRLIFGDSDPVPMLSLLDVPIPVDQLPAPKDSTASSGQWELMIQGFAVDDRTNPTDPAHVLMADVKRRLSRERAKANYRGADTNGIFGLGRYVTGIYIGSGVVRPPDEISAKAYFWLNMVLDLAEDLDDPYDAEG
jgi:hypothetical protein